MPLYFHQHFIAKVFNNQADINNFPIKLRVKATNGSVDNIEQLIKKELQVALVQEDILYHAFHGKKQWHKKPQKQIRAIFAVYMEKLALVARDDSKIDTLEGIKGKKINIGNKGSGSRATALEILNDAKIQLKKDAITEVRAIDAIDFLHEGKISAFFYMVVHPNTAIQIASQKNKVRLIPITNLSGSYPYYHATTIDKKLYPKTSNLQNTKTIGVKAILVTTKQIPTSTIRFITKQFFTHLTSFQKEYEKFTLLPKKKMIKTSIPIHEGALKYFRKVKLHK